MSNKTNDAMTKAVTKALLGGGKMLIGSTQSHALVVQVKNVDAYCSAIGTTDAGQPYLVELEYEQDEIRQNVL